MRHRVAGKRLGRTTSHRKALRRNMAASLIEHGAIRTTEAKAKQLRRFVERLITVARQGTLHARRRVIAMLQNRHAVDEEGVETERWIKKKQKGRTIVDVLFDEIAPRYADRPGGYTRIIRLSDRRIGDSGVQALLQLVEEKPPEAADAATGGRRRKRAAKRHQAAGAGAPEAADQGLDEQEEADDTAEDKDNGASEEQHDDGKK